MRARLGNVETLRGNLAAATAHHQALLDDPVASGVPWLRAMSLVGMSHIARRRADFGAADELLRRAWSMPRSQTVPFMRSNVLVGRGYLADQQDDYTSAIEHQVLALQTAIPLDTPRVLAFSFEGCAGALAIEPGGGRAELGARLLGAADRMRRQTGGPMPKGERFDVDRAEARLRVILGDTAFGDAFVAGASTDGLRTRCRTTGCDRSGLSQRGPSSRSAAICWILLSLGDRRPGWTGGGVHPCLPCCIAGADRQPAIRGG